MIKQYKETSSRVYEIPKDEVVRAIRAFLYDKNEILTPDTIVTINKDGSCRVTTIDLIKTNKTIGID